MPRVYVSDLKVGDVVLLERDSGVLANPPMPFVRKKVTHLFTTSNGLICVTFNGWGNETLSPKCILQIEDP